MISNKLKGADTKEKIACVSLNAWQFEGYEDAKIALMESLLKVLNENKTFAKKSEKNQAANKTNRLY